MPEEHTPLFEIRAALEGHGCPICGLVQRSVRRYLSALMFEGVTDRRQRDRIRSAWGFCAPHGRMLRDGRDALGSAIIHRDIVANLSRRLAAEQPSAPGPAARLRRALRPGRPRGPLPLAAEASCPACERAIESETRYVKVLVDGIGDAELGERYRRSAGLCAPHLRVALSAAAGSASYEPLRAAQQHVWEQLIAELDEFIRKQDHRFTHEPSGPEADSWRRAIELVSGQPESSYEESSG